MTKLSKVGGQGSGYEDTFTESFTDAKKTQGPPGMQSALTETRASRPISWLPWTLNMVVFASSAHAQTPQALTTGMSLEAFSGMQLQTDEGTLQGACSTQDHIHRTGFE